MFFCVKSHLISEFNRVGVIHQQRRDWKMLSLKNRIFLHVKLSMNYWLFTQYHYLDTLLGPKNQGLHVLHIVEKYDKNIFRIMVKGSFGGIISSPKLNETKNIEKGKHIFFFIFGSQLYFLKFLSS